MEYTTLGTSDIKVSRICLGCMGFGDATHGQHTWTVDETASRAIIAHALESGINFFDTAIGYQDGTSERYLGRSLADLADRDDVVVATKFLPRPDAEIDAGVTGQAHIVRSIDTSLAHLGMDYVDLYIYHMWDFDTPLHDIMEGLDQVVRSGRARAIGIANCYAWQLERANALAHAEGLTPFVSVQNHYNLIYREEEREMCACCEEEGIAMTPYSSLASGRLSRRPGETSKRQREDTYAAFKYAKSAEADRVVIDRVAEVADGHGVSMAEVSIAWLLGRVSAPIVGATKLHHIDAPVAAVDLELTADERNYLEEAYVPHALSGVMAQNRKADAGVEHVWQASAKYLEKD